MKKFGLAMAAAMLGLALGAMPGMAQDATFGDKLGTVPVDNAKRPSVSGSGAVTATLSGTTLTVEGTYRDLSADATGAAVFAGAAGKMGVDQTKTATLINTITASGTDGSFSGTIELTAEQVEVLNGSGLFVVVQTAANPDGEIRGWLVAGNTGVDTAVN